MHASVRHYWRLFYFINLRILVMYLYTKMKLSGMEGHGLDRSG